ncbi:MAG: hypothetical protein CBD26_03705 [Candidatus Pelagibacter sp. TMED166]|nr:MAG: hypothetical protein CBD26_03705 [Candidatus Pelagibacter sp. TMED166]|tara:strand:+ start:847 stop:1287 length:441 start_codon:yes stop_codon:yes gene_type:complete
MSKKNKEDVIHEESVENVQNDVNAFYDPKEIDALFQEDNISFSPGLKQKVEPTTELKEKIINHVGEKLDPEDDNVTVEMIVEVMATEFPEFVMAVAEENWIRGYHQALYDSDLGKEILEKQNKEIYERHVELAKQLEEAKKNLTIE